MRQSTRHNDNEAFPLPLLRRSRRICSTRGVRCNPLAVVDLFIYIQRTRFARCGLVRGDVPIRKKSSERTSAQREIFCDVTLFMVARDRDQPIAEPANLLSDHRPLLAVLTAELFRLDCIALARTL